jgi:murein DD-endopeptidase MepM/ murein hydrolase activator NlpD
MSSRRSRRLPLRLVVLVAALVPALLPGAGAAGGTAETTAVGVWPLRPQPEIVRRFDPPDSPWGVGHRGVDLAGRPGQVVRSSLFGRVTYAAALAGRGVVVVDHGATRTTYEPVRAEVRLGQTVSAGDRLGRLELTGSHCLPGACLHWGWISGEEYLDPLRLIGAAPVRLLPLSGISPAARWTAPRPRDGPWAQARGCACW